MSAAATALTRQFKALSALLPSVNFPLPLENADELRRLKVAVATQLRDYLIPRSARLDAPLLVVVGGSTGAGKSSVVNALLRDHVTRPGVLRPTTKSPVLICHPQDEAWFASSEILPSLTRTDRAAHDSRAMQIVPHPRIPAGLALLDAPDIDSIDDDNRKLARQLLQAADVWLFVTSAARYADAVGWDILEQAAARNTVISLVLNRCPAEAESDLISHLRQMLDERGLRAQQVFAVPELMAEHEFLPESHIAPIRRWLGSLAAESATRADVAVQSLAGATRALGPTLQQLAVGLHQQGVAVQELFDHAKHAFRSAEDAVAVETSDGSMLRGEVLSRWQDFVGTGDFMRAVEHRISALRDKLVGWFQGHATNEVDDVQVAITDKLSALILDQGHVAHEKAVQAWRLTAWGRQLVDAHPELLKPTPEFEDAAISMIRQWQSAVLKMVGEQGQSKRMKARLLATGTNALGAALIIVVFAMTGGLTAAEVGIAGGASLVAQRLLEAVFGEDAVRRLAEEAKADLNRRVHDLFASQVARFGAVVDQLGSPQGVVEQLLHRAAALDDAVTEVFADLTKPQDV